MRDSERNWAIDRHVSATQARDAAENYGIDAWTVCHYNGQRGEIFAESIEAAWDVIKEQGITEQVGTIIRVEAHIAWLEAEFEL